MITLKLIEIGTSTGIVLPKEMLARLRVKNGDTLNAIETEEGYLIRACDPTCAEQVEAGREIFGAFPDTFRALAK